MRLVAHADCEVVAMRRGAYIPRFSLFYHVCQSSKGRLLARCFPFPGTQVCALQTLARVKLCEVLDRVSLEEACKKVGFSIGSPPTVGSLVGEEARLPDKSLLSTVLLTLSCVKLLK